MNTGAKVAVAASAGYLLGRTKKLKLAIAVGLMVAGRKLPQSPMEMAGQGLQALQNNDQFTDLQKQVTDGLADAGKRAASRSAEQFLGKITDRLRDGMDSEDDDGDDQKPEEDSAAGDADSSADEADDEDDSAQENDEEAEEEPAARSKKSTSSKSGRSKKTAASKKAGG